MNDLILALPDEVRSQVLAEVAALDGELFPSKQQIGYLFAVWNDYKLGYPKRDINCYSQRNYILIMFRQMVA